MQQTSAPSTTDSISVPAVRARTALVIMVASGGAGLGYQIVWTQQSALWLGHEAAAVLAVVAAFFGGTAVGAWTLSARIDRSRNPARWYAACEAIIGLWGVALAFLVAPVTSGLLHSIGAQPTPLWHWSVAFCGTFILLLPATAAMGATLPAMERIVTGMRGAGASIAILYAGNTLGAVLGVLAAAFVLVPVFGLKLTALACAVLNFGCAAMALRLPAAGAATEPPRVTRHAPEVLLLLMTTGFLAIGFEVVVVRVLSQIAENTVYTFAILLAVYLIGTTLGAAAYARGLFGSLDHECLRDRLLLMLAAACLLSVLSLISAPTTKHFIVQALGNSMTAALAAETALAAGAFLLPTIVMGALFSHLSTAARARGIRFGRALGCNTIGAAVAPLLFGVLLVPAFGTKLALLLIVAGYLAVTSPRAWRAWTQWSVVGACVAVAMWAPTLAIVDIPAGGRLVRHTEGTMASVSIVEDASGVARLQINNRQQEGSSATRFADARQALLPILLQPGPRHALFLGLGTGVTAASAAEDATLSVDAVELLPEVIEASGYFTQSFGAGRDARLHLIPADARRFVRSAHEYYDVIVADNFHPARSGSGALYTVEHFAAIRERLAPGGVFCQWLPLHQLDLATLRSIVRTFLAVYPHGWAMLATNSLDTPVVGLVSRNDDAVFYLEEIRARVEGTTLPLDLPVFGIEDELALLGAFIAGPRSLAHFAGAAPVNTDDHPVVTYLAPRITYVPDSLPRDRLLELLRAVAITPGELLAADDDVRWRSRLVAYWSARNQFIAAGHDVQPTRDVKRMLAQVRAPLLSVLHTSPDFRPAYDPLLQMAGALGAFDPPAARALLDELQHAQPARQEARQALQDLLQRTP